MACFRPEQYGNAPERFAGCCIMNGADDIIASAENKGVRMFTVPKHQTYEPQTDCKGSWNISSIETAPDFSATAYYLPLR